MSGLHVARISVLLFTYLAVTNQAVRGTCNDNFYTARSEDSRAATSNAQKLVAVVVGGRATGSWLPREVKALGYKVVHIYPAAIDAGIAASFNPQDYDFPAITYRDDKDLAEVIASLQALASKHGLVVSGFVPGMDYGVMAAGALSAAFSLPGNSVSLADIRGDKAKLNQFVANRGVPVARGFSVSAKEALQKVNELQFPLYLKPVASWGSVGAGPSFTAKEFPQDLARLRSDVEKIGLTFDEVFLLEKLHGDKVYFVDTVSTVIKQKLKRIVTGIWIDYRGDDFAKEVWDYIEMMPPPGTEAQGGDAELFANLLIANERVLAASEVSVGTSHLEFMARTGEIKTADDLLPTDLNLRGPGLRTWHLEQRATTINPFALEVMSRTAPASLSEHEEVYSKWREHVALIFIRAFSNGNVQSEALAWLQSLRTAQPEYDGAYLAEILMPPALSPTQTTVNGSTMVGVLHAAGPNSLALRKLYTEIRRRERAGFFSK